MEQYRLTNSDINLTCKKIGMFLEKCGVERQEMLRAKLTFEELLLEYQSKFGQEANFKLRCINRFLSARVEILIAGESYNPLSQENEENDLAQSILARIGLAPTWNYKNGKNCILFIPKKKPLSGTVKMAAAIALSFVAGIILSRLPEEIRLGVNEYALIPMTDAFMGLISAVAGPLIFLSVLGSICAMGNMETLGKIGSKTIKVILLYMSMIGIGMTALSSLFFQVERSGGDISGFWQVLDLIYDIIPGNLLEPFVTGNALQLIFVAIMVGLAMLVLSTRVNGVFSLVEQFSAIIQTMMAGLSSGLPFLIFVLFTGMISGGNLELILNSWKMVLVIILLIAVYYILNLLRIAVTKKISPALLLKKTAPTLLIALTTASSAAAFATNTRDAHQKFGIDDRLVAFGIPLGQVLFMPGFIALLFGMELAFAESYGIPITVPWIIIGLVINLLLAFAIPPVPGGPAMCYTIAFTQLGIPMEAMGIAIAVGAIIDYFGTACNVSSWQLNLIDVADSLDMLDKEVLFSDN